MQTCNCVNTWRYLGKCVVCGAAWSYSVPSSKDNWIESVINSYIRNSPYGRDTFIPECDKTLGEILDKLKEGESLL